MAINFNAFCKNYAVTEKVIITDETDFPEVYKKTVEKIVDDLKYRTEDFDTISVDYIQMTLDSVGDINKALNYTAGDIPDGIMNTLATELYGNLFNLIDEDAQPIIITIAAYICIAKNKKLN